MNALRFTAGRVLAASTLSIVVAISLTGCNAPTSQEKPATDTAAVLQEALLGLDDVPAGWEAIWTPPAAAEGEPDTTTTPAGILDALARLEQCSGADAPIFLTDAEPTVTGSTLTGSFGAGEGAVPAQVDSYAYTFRGSAAQLNRLIEDQACLGSYMRERIAVSLGQPSLVLSGVETVVLSTGLPQGVIGLRFSVTVSNGESEIPFTSTLLAAGSGSVTVFYDIATAEGAAPDSEILRLAELLKSRLEEVSDAL